MLPPEYSAALASLAQRDQLRRTRLGVRKSVAGTVDASASQKGAVELADDGEDAPNVVVQGNDYRLPVIVKKTSDQTTSVPGLQSDTALAFNIRAERYYHFRFICLISSTEAAIGIRLSIAFPSATRFGATAKITIAGPGTSAEFQGAITSSGDMVTTSSLADQDTDYIATVEGLIISTTDGSVQLQFGDEAGFSAITIRKGSVGFLYDLGG